MLGTDVSLGVEVLKSLNSCASRGFSNSLEIYSNYIDFLIDFIDFDPQKDLPHFLDLDCY